MSYRRKNSPKDFKQSVTILSIMLTLGSIGYVVFMVPLYSKGGMLRNSDLHVPGQVTRSYSSKGTAYAEFNYSVNQISYHARSEIPQQARPGDPVEVYYIPSDPSFASVDPQKMGRGFQTGTIICGLTLVAVAILSTLQRRQYKRLIRGGP